MKDPKKMGVALILLLIVIVVPLTSALTYTVKSGDNLTKIAEMHGTTVDEIAAANNIGNPNVIFIGQTLEIPDNNEQDSSVSPQSIPTDLPNTPATTETRPNVSTHKSCTRFNFLQGRDSSLGASAGVFVMEEVTNGALVTWYANEGEKDSGWINGFNISYNAVHVKVLFYANDGTGIPIEMEIVNHAPDSSYGWLSRGACHAVEIQYPTGSR